MNAEFLFIFLHAFMARLIDLRFMPSRQLIDIDASVLLKAAKSGLAYRFIIFSIAFRRVMY